jgi:hypothetical protein
MRNPSNLALFAELTTEVAGLASLMMLPERDAGDLAVSLIDAAVAIEAGLRDPGIDVDAELRGLLALAIEIHDDFEEDDDVRHAALEVASAALRIANSGQEIPIDPMEAVASMRAAVN